MTVEQFIEAAELYWRFVIELKGYIQILYPTLTDTEAEYYAKQMLRKAAIDTDARID